MMVFILRRTSTRDHFAYLALSFTPTNYFFSGLALQGMGELHLDIIVDRMKREFDVGAIIGAPQVVMLLRSSIIIICIPPLTITLQSSQA